VPGNLRAALSHADANVPTLITCPNGKNLKVSPKDPNPVHFSINCGVAISKPLLNAVLNGRSKQAMHSANIIFDPYFYTQAPRTVELKGVKVPAVTIPFNVEVDNENKKRMKHDEGQLQLNVVHYLLTGVRARQLHINKCIDHQCDF
jgi:hypothetical protein